MQPHIISRCLTCASTHTQHGNVFKQVYKVHQTPKCVHMWCRYSKDGLQGLVSLRNKDRAIASVMQQLADKHCLEVHLILLQKDKSGVTDGYKDFDEVYANYWTALHCVMLDGQPGRLVDMNVWPKEIIQVHNKVAGH